MTWDEPEDDLAEVIEAIWALNGEPFEVIQEGFQRLELHTIQHAGRRGEPGGRLNRSGRPQWERIPRLDRGVSAHRAWSIAWKAR